MLSKEAIEEFKEIYKKKFNEDISDQKAFKLGSNLLNLYKLLFDDKNPNLKKQPSQNTN